MSHTLGLLPSTYIKIHSRQAYNDYRLYITSPQATLARLVVLVTDGSNDDIFKPTYHNLQNTRFSAKTSIRNLSQLTFYKVTEAVNGKKLITNQIND